MQFPPAKSFLESKRWSLKALKPPARQSEHYCLSPSPPFLPIPLNFSPPPNLHSIFFSSRKHNFSVGRLIACAEKLGGETEIGNWIGRRTKEGRKGGREGGGVPFASQVKLPTATQRRRRGSYEFCRFDLRRRRGGAGGRKRRKKGFAVGGFLLGHFPQSISAIHLSLSPSLCCFLSFTQKRMPNANSASGHRKMERTEALSVLVLRAPIL